MAKILILFTLLSCTKYNEVKKANGLHYIEKVHTKLEDAKIVDWEVGREKDVTISKGIRLYITVPNITDEGKDLLAAKYGISSIVYRLSRIRRGSIQSLGYFHYRLNNITRTTKNFTLSLFYHAASVSKRFRLFHCPAFNHRSIIEDYNVEKIGFDAEDIYIRPVEIVPAKVTRLRFAPMIVSGGTELKGKYILEYAFYNESSKRRFSNWHKVDGVLNIENEVIKTLPSCVGVKEELEPLPESRVPDIRDLEIK